MANNKLGRTYIDDEVIIKQGEEGNCLYVVQEGMVGIFRENNGKETKMANLGPSEFFGEMGLFERDVRSATVRSIGTTKILTIDKKNFYKTIQKDPSLAYRLLENMSKRLRETNKMIG